VGRQRVGRPLPLSLRERAGVRGKRGQCRTFANIADARAERAFALTLTLSPGEREQNG
jgi:hypothetical protein